jgi:hypothetical protein
MSDNHATPRPTRQPFCSVYAPLLPLLHSGELAEQEQASVEAHLADCAWCQNQLTTFDIVDAALRWHYASEPKETASAASLGSGSHPGMRPDLTLEDIMKADQKQASTTSAQQLPSPARHQPARMTKIAALGTIAAVLLITILAAVLFAQRGAPSHSAGPRPTSTPANPTATATPTGPTVLFQNSLASPPDSSWPNDPSIGCFFAGGSFHAKQIMNCGIPASVSYSEPTGMYENADITVQVKQIGGPATGSYGIGLGNTVQWDRFDIESTGKWSFLDCQGANCTAIVSPTASAAIRTGLGATNTLEVRVVSNHFDFFVNGTKVGQADDINYLNRSGQFALDGSDTIEVVFNNLKIATAS